MRLSAVLALLGLVAVGNALAAPTKEISSHPLGERSVFSERATIERIKPVGSVCVEGTQDKACSAPAPVAAAGASAAPRTGDQVYGAVCAGCHGAGVMGAPKFGNKGDWSPRLAQGLATVTDHALKGFKGMPAKGGCAACSDDEIKNAVKHMADAAK